jgi:hypothetical protein
MSTLVYAVGRSELAPYAMPDRFRLDIAYFMSVSDEPGDEAIASGEYRIRRAEALQWLDDGVFLVVSPLDSASHTEVELTEEQEAWLQWLVDNGIERVRVG